MTTYPLDTLGPTITPAGITAPSYADILASLTASMRAIFGDDLYIDPDSQDGQMLGIVALSINDSNNAVIAVYNSFSPATAQGAELSSVVKINGISRNAATNSTAVVKIIGQNGATITSGLVRDLNGLTWSLPATVNIGPSGEADVTATCTQQGAIKAPAHTITQIATPTQGWQSVDNADDAVPGAPVETDAALRRRQADSAALPAVGNLEAIMAAVAAVPGIQSYKGYENPTGAPDANGIPAHSIAIIAEGGDASDICQAIALKKSPGTGTYGSVSQTIVDQYGIPVTIYYFPQDAVTITVQIAITALPGYGSATGTALVAAVAAFINSLDAGTDVYLSWVLAEAQLINQPQGETYVVTSIMLARSPATPTAANVTIAFSEAAVCSTSNITLTVS